MPTFKTLLRAAVMLVAAILIVKGWQLHGPTTQQLKTWTARIAERVHVALSDQPQLAPANGEPLGEAKPLKQLPVTLPIVVPPATSRLEEGEFLAVPPLNSDPAQTGGTTTRNSTANAAPRVMHSDRMPTLLARLEQLGAVDTQLAPWGQSGSLYRFCCRAARTDMPRFTRHFESVAAEPHLAVEEVVAKVEAWCSQRQASSTLQ
jgi:hypothetical protein